MVVMIGAARKALTQRRPVTAERGREGRRGGEQQLQYTRGAFSLVPALIWGQS